MKIRNHEATDMLYFELCESPVAETRDIGEDAISDFGAEGAIRGITIEHATRRAGAPAISIEKVSRTGRA